MYVARCLADKIYLSLTKRASKDNSNLTDRIVVREGRGGNPLTHVPKIVAE